MLGAGCATLLGLAWLARPYVERLVCLLEQRLAVLVPPPPLRLEAPPQDLIALALSESTGWAREDALAALHEMHADCGYDWDKTRRAYFTVAQGTRVSSDAS